MLRSYLAAATGGVCVETREESRFLTHVLNELPDRTEVAVTAAPSGGVYLVRMVDGEARKDREPLIPAKGMGQQTLPDAYAWAQTAPGRVLIVLDWHMLANTPGHWRMLLEALPGLRSPRAGNATSGSSLVAFVGPAFDLSVQNPLKGNLPVLQFALPDRDGLLECARRCAPIPADQSELIVDALCGLGAVSAEQVSAEVLAECGYWNVDRLRTGRKAELKAAGMEVWGSEPELGGLTGLRSFVDDSLIPWLRDPQLSIRRLLMAGVPGCLHADTPIHDPVDGTTKTVAERFADGVVFSVFSLDHETGLPVIASAEKPWKYPAAEMVRFTLSDGQEITVTLGHRFWGKGEYVQAATILSCFQKYGVYQLPKPDAAFLESLRQDACRSTGTTGDSQECYSGYCHLGDEQPLVSPDACQEPSPSPVGAPVRSPTSFATGALASTHTSSRQQSCDHHATTDSCGHSAGLTECESQPRHHAESGGHLPSECEQGEQSHSSRLALRSTVSSLVASGLGHVEDSRCSSLPGGSEDGFSARAPRSTQSGHTDVRSADDSGQSRSGSGTLQLSCASSDSYVGDSSNNIDTVTIVNAELVGSHEYFDFHVPQHENYLAAGVFHHNTGKSYCAKWIAHRIGCECVRVSMPALKGGIVGQSEANLRRCLRTLDAMGKYSPLVVVLDEIDTIARDGLDGGTSSGMFAELLTWLQESDSQCVVVATLNHLTKLDAALDSRFSTKFFFDLPTEEERRSISLMYYLKFGCESAGQAATDTARLTDGYSSREIAEQIIPEVARLSLRQPAMEHIVKAKGLITPSSVTQAGQLADMRAAAQRLRRANTPSGGQAVDGRRVTTGNSN